MLGLLSWSHEILHYLKKETTIIIFLILVVTGHATILKSIQTAENCRFFIFINFCFFLTITLVLSLQLVSFFIVLCRQNNENPLWRNPIQRVSNAMPSITFRS